MLIDDILAFPTRKGVSILIKKENFHVGKAKFKKIE